MRLELRRSGFSASASAFGRRYVASLRVVAYGMVVFAVFGLVTARAAAGAVGEASLALGRQLDGLRDVLGNTKTLELNGQPMFVSTSVVPGAVKDVLDRFQGACDARPGELAIASDALSRGAPAKGAPGHFPSLRVLRREDEKDGVLACFVRRTESQRPVGELLRELKRTQDFGLLGDGFFVYARSTGSGATHVITTSTFGSFKALSMFPPEGDVPGSDSSLAARPPHARRVLSALAAGAPYGVRAYESEDAPDVVLAAFDAEMAKRGWAAVPAKIAGDGRRAHAFMHPSGVSALVCVGVSRGRTLVSLVETGDAGKGPGGRGAKS